jgi:hypothetical protein
LILTLGRHQSLLRRLPDQTERRDAQDKHTQPPSSRCSRMDRRAQRCNVAALSSCGFMPLAPRSGLPGHRFGSCSRCRCARAFPVAAHARAATPARQSCWRSAGFSSRHPGETRCAGLRPDWRQ